MAHTIVHAAAVARPLKPQATIVGLLLALGAPLLLLPTGLLRGALEVLAPQYGVEQACLREAFFWVLTLSVLLVLRFGEGLTLADIRWRSPRWATLLWGVGAFVASFALQPIGMLMLRSIGGAMPTGAMQKLVGEPVWLLALTLVRAGVCEEILFRGYAIERLTALTGSRILGLVAPALVFMAGHIETFGIKYAVSLIPVTTVLTALYAWRRDLWANMLAHFLTDGVSVAMILLLMRAR